jgi:hypothetical protein
MATPYVSRSGRVIKKPDLYVPVERPEDDFSDDDEDADDEDEDDDEDADEHGNLKDFVVDDEDDEGEDDEEEECD